MATKASSRRRLLGYTIWCVSAVFFFLAAVSGKVGGSVSFAIPISMFVIGAFFLYEKE
jgi:hypothetical protein